FTQFTNLGMVSFNSLKFQIAFRIICHDYNDKYLEIMFTDVSKVIESEREKAIVTSRSQYLSIIAHEFKNPLTNLMELSTRIKEELYKSNEVSTHSKSNFLTYNAPMNLNKINISNISNMTEYSYYTCKILIQFLNNFSLFSNLKYPCNNFCSYV